MAAAPPQRDGAVFDGDRRIRNNGFGHKDELGADAVAFRASSEGAVEGEVAREEFAEGDAAVDAGEMFGELLFMPAARSRGIFHKKIQNAVAFFQREFDGVRETRAVGLSCDQAVHDGFDRVAFCLGDFEIVVKGFDFAVEADADEAVLPDVFDDFGVFAFATVDVGGENHDFEAGGEGVDLAADGVRGLRMDDAPAVRAMRNADMCVHKTQIIIYFSRGRDNGAR